MQGANFLIRCWSTAKWRLLNAINLAVVIAFAVLFQLEKRCNALNADMLKRIDSLDEDLGISARRGLVQSARDFRKKRARLSVHQFEKQVGRMTTFQLVLRAKHGLQLTRTIAMEEIRRRMEIGKKTEPRRC